MSADMHAVGTALAASFAAVTAPAGTMGGTAIRYDSVGAQGVPSTPAIIIERPEGEVTTALAVTPTRSDNDFHVYFLFSKASGDVPRDEGAMLKWLGPLLMALHGGYRLGLADESGWHVLKAWITSYTPGTYDVGGQPYHAWHFIVRVNIEDNTAATQ